MLSQQIEEKKSVLFFWWTSRLSVCSLVVLIASSPECTESFSNHASLPTGAKCLPGPEQQTDWRHCGTGTGQAIQTEPGDPRRPRGARRPRQGRARHAGAEGDKRRERLWVAQPTALLLGGTWKGQFKGEFISTYRTYSVTDPWTPPPCRRTTSRPRWSTPVCRTATNTWATLRVWLLPRSLTAATGKATKKAHTARLCL